ncbi:MAG: hypothetical protein CSA68_06610 [Rhodobacterales bacterium]|nr:MAG: hypothetical protein CSA68_06610 [Rhodobacterales bacterium]
MSDSANCCALCAAQTGLTTHPVGPENTASLTLCETCAAAMNGDIQDAPHWKCLNDAIWSPDAATQVLAYRLLHRLSDQVWARELLEIAYLEPETLAWAQAGLASDPDEPALIHRDTNGAQLAGGDTVVLIKDLNVKGAGFTAKRGTAVRNISLVPDNEAQIEGRVNGQRIVILTEFVKKS